MGSHTDTLKQTVCLWTADNLADFFVPFREAMNVGEADVLTWFTVTEGRAHSVDYTSCSLVNFVNEVGVWVLDSSELAGTNLTAKPDALDGYVRA